MEDNKAVFEICKMTAAFSLWFNLIRLKLSTSTARRPLGSCSMTAKHPWRSCYPLQARREAPTPDGQVQRSSTQRRPVDDARYVCCIAILFTCQPLHVSWRKSLDCLPYIAVPLAHAALFMHPDLLHTSRMYQGFKGASLVISAFVSNCQEGNKVLFCMPKCSVCGPPASNTTTWLARVGKDETNRKLLSSRFQDNINAFDVGKIQKTCFCEERPMHFQARGLFVAIENPAPLHAIHHL